MPIFVKAFFGLVPNERNWFGVLSAENRAAALAEHTPGFMPGVLTTVSREMVTISRVNLGGIPLRTFVRQVLPKT